VRPNPEPLEASLNSLRWRGPPEQLLSEPAPRRAALHEGLATCRFFLPQTPALYGDATEVNSFGAPKSFRLHACMPTTKRFPVGTFSSQEPRGVWPDLTSESYPVAPEGVIGRR
jgi:hypothetical protein